MFNLGLIPLLKDFFFATAEPKAGFEAHGASLWWLNKTVRSHVHTMELSHKPKGLTVFAKGRHKAGECMYNITPNKQIKASVFIK